MHIITLDALMSDVRRFLHLVQAGDHLTITQQGRPIVVITPANPEDARHCGHRAVADGLASWNGERPWIPAEVVPCPGVDITALIREMRDSRP